MTRESHHKKCVFLTFSGQKRRLYEKIPHFRAEFFRWHLSTNATWSCWADLNRRPHPYQGCALPTELHQHLPDRQQWDYNTVPQKVQVLFEKNVGACNRAASPGAPLPLDVYPPPNRQPAAAPFVRSARRRAAHRHPAAPHPAQQKRPATRLPVQVFHANAQRNAPPPCRAPSGAAETTRHAPPDSGSPCRCAARTPPPCRAPSGTAEATRHAPPDSGFSRRRATRAIPSFRSCISPISPTPTVASRPHGFVAAHPDFSPVSHVSAKCRQQ